MGGKNWNALQRANDKLEKQKILLTFRLSPSNIITRKEKFSSRLSAYYNELYWNRWKIGTNKPELARGRRSNLWGQGEAQLTKLDGHVAGS